MIYEVTINNKTYEVEVEKGQATVLTTKAATPVVVPQAVPAAAPAAPVAQAAPAAVNIGNGEAISAPMPGNILDVKVVSGSQVKKGDILVILEAMKMENEIVAPKDGVVQIQTAKGSTVNTGDILAVIQ